MLLVDIIMLLLDLGKGLDEIRMTVI